MKENKGDSLATLTDVRLLERIGQGDDAAFELLFYRHYDRIYGLLFRLVGNRGEAEDLTQEVFIKLYYHRFGSDREHNVGAWLYRVATNMGHNALRGRRRRWQRNVALVPDVTEQPADPAESVAQRQARDSVRAALAELPTRDVQLLLLRQMGVSYAELAEICGIAPGSVGTSLRRAAARFRKRYGEQTSERREA